MITPNPGPPATSSRATNTRFRRFLCYSSLLLAGAILSADDGALGLFRDHTDIGAPKHAGVVVHQAATNAYTVSGSGANMWFKADSFHYVWKKVEGDVAIEADISFPQAGGNAHRKGVLMIRQTLDADAAYADVALHGDGLTSLQFRETAGDVTHEVQCVVKAPRRVRLEKIGDYVYLSLVGEDGWAQPTGCSTRVEFKASFYIGVGVCAHDENAFEQVVFSQVKIGAPMPGATTVHHSVEYVKVPSGDRVCLYPSGRTMDPVDWTKDEIWLYAVGGGDALIALHAAQSTAKPAQASVAPQPTNGTSPDGKWTATFEHQGGEAVLTLRATADGRVRELMRLSDQADAPVAIAWSPDSTKIAYVRLQPAPAAK